MRGHYRGQLWIVEGYNAERLVLLARADEYCWADPAAVCFVIDPPTGEAAEARRRDHPGEAETP